MNKSTIASGIIGFVAGATLATATISTIFHTGKLHAFTVEDIAEFAKALCSSSKSNASEDSDDSEYFNEVLEAFRRDDDDNFNWFDAR